MSTTDHKETVRRCPAVDRLIELIRASGLTGRQICRRCDVTESQVSQILNGHSGPSLRTAEGLLRAIGRGWADLGTPSTTTGATPNASQARQLSRSEDR